MILTKGIAMQSPRRPIIALRVDTTPEGVATWQKLSRVLQDERILWRQFFRAVVLPATEQFLQLDQAGRQRVIAAQDEPRGAVKEGVPQSGRE